MKRLAQAAVLVCIVFSAHAKLYFFDGFEGNGFGNWAQIQHKGTGTMQCVTPSGFKARAGKKVMKIDYKSGKRIEISKPKASSGQTAKPGDELWYAFSTYLPSGIARNTGMVTQWHGLGTTGVPLMVGNNNDGAELGIRNVWTSTPFLGGKTIKIKQKRDTWYDFVFHIKWSKGNDGLCEIWAGTGGLDKSKPIFSRKNVTTMGYNNRLGPDQVQKEIYWKMGVYTARAPTIRYWDEVRIGSSFEDVVPGGGNVPPGGSGESIEIIGPGSGTGEGSGSQGESRPKVTGELKAAGATASSDDGNGPQNAIDGNLDTRWSASGDGAHLTIDLGKSTTVLSVGVAFFRGNERTAKFDILRSDDGEMFTPVKEGVESSGSSKEVEWFDPGGPVDARYIRIVGHGNSVNDWNSITEVVLKGEGGVVPVVQTGMQRLNSVASSPFAGMNSFNILGRGIQRKTTAALRKGRRIFIANR